MNTTIGGAYGAGNVTALPSGTPGISSGLKQQALAAHMLQQELSGQAGVLAQMTQALALLAPGAGGLQALFAPNGPAATPAPANGEAGKPDPVHSRKQEASDKAAKLEEAQRKIEAAMDKRAQAGDMERLKQAFQLLAAAIATLAGSQQAGGLSAAAQELAKLIAQMAAVLGQAGLPAQVHDAVMQILAQAGLAHQPPGTSDPARKATESEKQADLRLRGPADMAQALLDQLQDTIGQAMTRLASATDRYTQIMEQVATQIGDRAQDAVRSRVSG
ncbi:hypothetical protein V8Z80_17485 [Orrella sp. JC864]|uniref:hypothetical protein n=1 Tax=Orrella sp. JC864 TaxID=3120298 RepID=UPI0030089670